MIRQTKRRRVGDGALTDEERTSDRATESYQINNAYSASLLSQGQARSYKQKDIQIQGNVSATSSTHRAQRSAACSSSSSPSQSIRERIKEQRVRLEDTAEQIEHLSQELELGNCDLVLASISPVQDQLTEVIENLDGNELQAKANIMKASAVNAALTDVLVNEVKVFTADEREERCRIATQKLIEMFGTNENGLDIIKLDQWIFRNYCCWGLYPCDRYPGLQQLHLVHESNQEEDERVCNIVENVKGGQRRERKKTNVRQLRHMMMRF